MADNRFGTLVGEGGTATQLDDGLWLIDLGFRSREGVIGSFLLVGDDEVALIETGPATTLPALRAGIRDAGFAPADVNKVLVTHIHIDHAGASGVLARENPDLKVFVHPLGAPHLIDPTKLLISAGRIYGDRMEDLWGEVPPVPADQVVSLNDGETLSIAGRPIAAIFTPGHATHHVAFWNPDTGALFTGDAAGCECRAPIWSPRPSRRLILTGRRGSRARAGCRTCTRAVSIPPTSACSTTP
ncbi:MAG TPA: MBL fold metallo-hydrolase, partial [Thermomicrobiales bacterium]|nr:MBL fold metallo-hydrolase [Thermomicrobiales bacterium]